MYRKYHMIYHILFVVLIIGADFYLKRFIFYLHVYEKMAVLVVTIVRATTAYEQRLMTYTNSDASYVMEKVKV